ncbi:MAG: alpha/beta hydrolase [Actinomycetota bacterium]|nr:alpha/beta hydrolase [Actinomycetota bacterium]
MTTFDQAPVQEARLPQGTIRYREVGTGDPILLVHGFMVNSLLWRKVIPRLAQDFRVIAPDWPMGSHPLPMGPRADLTPPGFARLIADFMAELDLDDVTLVGNDTGGGMCQLVVVDHPERVGRLVLTPSDSYENFPPPLFRPLKVIARIPGGVRAVIASLGPRPARRLPMSYGWVSKRPIDDWVLDAWLEPARRDAGVRADIAALLIGISPRYTLAAAERLHEFDRPVLIAWAPEDKFFPFEHGERLAKTFPNARLERIEDSRTFVSEDQPERTAQLIAEFAREPKPQAARST